MRKNNNYFFLLVLLAGVSCTKKTPVTLVSTWDQKSSLNESLDRRLASSPQVKCFGDRFTVPHLREEVSKLERPHEGAARISGTWKHLSLASLPVPQANFLKRYGNEIGDLKNKESIDYSACSDVPCIFNKIYGQDEGVAGYVHYLWYLRFGHMLSADNLVPYEPWLKENPTSPGVHAGKSLPLSAYLYSEKELYALWKLSNMLRPPYTTLKNLKEFQRIPRGERFENGNAGACGLAYTSGWILVTDSCLEINDRNRDSGYLYHAVTHELAHHVDSHEGKGSSKIYRSQKEDYLELSGLYEEEVVVDGNLKRTWKVRPGAKLIKPYTWYETPYSGMSPQENFAESVSLFRLMGEIAKRDLSDPHHSFVSDGYYQSSLFTDEKLIESWFSDYQRDIDMLVHEAVTECKSSKGNERSAYFKSSDFKTETLPGMMNCLGSKAQKISEQIKALSMSEKPDACVLMNDSTRSTKWEGKAKASLTASFDKYLQELKKDQEYSERLQSFYKEISNRTMAIDAFVNCYREPNEESCYLHEIQTSAVDKALSLNLPESFTKEMSERYIAHHPYDKTKAHVLQSYQSIILSNSDLIRRESRLIWDGCQNLSHNDDQTPSGSHFLVGSGYMISSFYNCLNMQIPDSVKEIVRSLKIEGRQLQHAKEELILTEEVKGSVVNILKDYYQKNKTTEATLAKDFIKNDSGALRKLIMSDFSWVKSILDAKNIAADCRKEVMRLMSFLPLYHTKSELFGDYIDNNVCAGIATSKELTTWIDSSKEVFAQKVSANIEEKLYASGEIQAAECLKRYPNDTAINRIRFKKQREACLTDNWSSIENNVLSEFTADPVVIRLKIPRDDIKSQIEASRRKIQLKLIKDKFN